MEKFADLISDNEKTNVNGLVKGYLQIFLRCSFFFLQKFVFLLSFLFNFAEPKDFFFVTNSDVTRRYRENNIKFIMAEPCAFYRLKMIMLNP